MRVTRRVVVAVHLLVCVALLSGANRQETDAGAAWLRSRQAIGDVASLKALTLRGREVSGFNAITGEFGEGKGPVDVQIVLPDHYLEMKERHYGDKRVIALRTGFRGSVRIRELDRTRTSSGITGPDPATGPPTSEQRDFARLMLALALRNDTVLPLSVQLAGAGVGFELRGSAGLHVFVDIDAKTRLPTRIRYREERRFPAKAPALLNRPTVVVPSMPAPRQAEVSLILEDRRTVSGLNLPFRIRDVADGVTFRITQFDEIIVNPHLRPADFRKRPVPPPAAPGGSRRLPAHAGSPESVGPAVP
jgi:hypothetical protein